MSEHAAGTPIEILLVEDNPGDVRLTMEAFRENGVSNHLSVVVDGVQAMAFLHREGQYAGAPRPDLILLDLNLPKKDGREVLAEIGRDPDLRRIPVVVMTTSQAEQDILKTYDLQASCYFTKPIEWHQFTAIIRSIQDFWLTIVRLPVDDMNGVYSKSVMRAS